MLCTIAGDHVDGVLLEDDLEFVKSTDETYDNTPSASHGIIAVQSKNHNT